MLDREDISDDDVGNSKEPAVDDGNQRPDPVQPEVVAVDEAYGGGDHPLEEEFEKGDRLEADDPMVSKLNEAWMKYVEGLRKPIGLKNITVVEVLERRELSQIVEAIGRVYARLRALGVPVLRIHTDREKGFLSSSFQKWCRQHNLYQTMSSGDDGPANGRVETEVHQIKRRIRALMASTGFDVSLWPSAARWAGEERCRAQLAALGVPSKPMIPLGEMVVVKAKRWHKKGPLAAPFKSMMLMAPSPLVSNGWVVRLGKSVQHARAVVRPDAMGEKAVLELYDASRRRITGKQPLFEVDRKVPPPLQHDDLPDLLQEDLGLSDDVWGEDELAEQGEAEFVDRGEDVESLAYSPDAPPLEDAKEGSFRAQVETVAARSACETTGHDGDGGAGQPALRVLRAGGSIAPPQFQMRILKRLQLWMGTEFCVSVRIVDCCRGRWRQVVAFVDMVVLLLGRRRRDRAPSWRYWECLHSRALLLRP
eukprot:s9_g50.t1